MHLRPAKLYNLPSGQPLLWGQVAEAVRSRRETFLGMVQAGSAKPQLAPDAAAEVMLGAGHMLVVLAREG